jgi:ribosomal protein L28
MDSTLKQMQAFAAEHPELGPIAGRSKADFLENLTAAWMNKSASVPAPAEAQVEEAEELPVGMGNTLKEMQAFAASRPELGEIQGKTKAAFFANLTEAWSKSATGEAAAEPVAKDEAEEEVQGTIELPVDMTCTLKAMQAFAADHPELGEIQGKTKAVFLANLTEAWKNRGYTEATLPVSAASTLKEMQQFAEKLSASIGDMPKKSVAKAAFFDDLTSRLRASGLLR